MAATHLKEPTFTWVDDDGGLVLEWCIDAHHRVMLCWDADEGLYVSEVTIDSTGSEWSGKDAIRQLRRLAAEPAE